MPEPTIVPPIPTVAPGDSPAEVAAAVKHVTDIFDRTVPQIRGTPSEPPNPSEVKNEPVKAPTEPVTPPEEPVKPPVEKPPDDSHKIPSFLEEALKTEPVKPGDKPGEVQPDEWPEELPTFQNSEEAKERYKKWRTEYKTLKDEVGSLRSRPAGPDEATTQRLTTLEKDNKQMAEMLSKVSLDNHPEFQREVLQPLHQAWGDACRIVKEAGGDPVALQAAMSKQGRAQFEALDELFTDMPESAKMEAHEALRSFRRYNDKRTAALREAPKTLEKMRKADMDRAYTNMQEQKKEMGYMFDSVMKELRENAKLEVLQTSADPDAKWWNEQAQKIEETGRKVFLENTDMRKVALSLALAPMVDVYRKLWLATMKQNEKLNGVMNGRLGSEPVISDAGGGGNGAPDISEPFKNVFLRELHKQAR